MSAFNASAAGGSKVGGGTGASSKPEEKTQEEVDASRRICQKEYLAGIEVAKQKYVAMWKTATRQQDSASFEEQLDRASQPTDNSCQDNNHPFVQLFINADLSSLNEALFKEENRLDEVKKRLEAELNAVDDGILHQVQEIVPDYKRVIRITDRDDNENDNILRVNKLVENMLLQQVKLAEVHQKLNMACEDNPFKDKAKTEAKKGEGEQATRVKIALGEVRSSRSKCQEEYRTGVEAAKQKYIAMWKTATRQQDSTSFEEQLNRATSNSGSSQVSDHPFVQLFINADFSTLYDAWQKEENRLDEDEKKLEAELNAVDDGILRQVQEIIPGYERVVLRDNDDGFDDNMLRINKLLENVLLLQDKVREEMRSILDIKVAAVKIEREIRSVLDAAVKIERERLAKIAAQQKQLIFSSVGDTNGVLYFIGTRGGTASYENPHSANSVVATDSSVKNGTVEYIVGREDKYFYTHNSPGGWVKVDIGQGRLLVPDYYSFKHGLAGANHFIRNWRLEGSIDDINWVTLREHTNDTTINGVYAPGSWSIANPGQSAYRYFRVYQTRENSSGHEYLMLCCLELYGKYSWDSTAY